MGYVKIIRRNLKKKGSDININVSISAGSTAGMSDQDFGEVFHHDNKEENQQKIR